ncbi:PEP/pyruvate-binding domain-containing protein [Hyalangium rubrum]|uniref:PEP/pyruvate-binding domain-containing protein n=1 Tax=Hyalangium rubrum TaxID=3103134 RepID=A0ABU5H182_9BACT|nr:PEP/pyruvate-binding domain-containing protein [Hyalangium sp. s54d21]MDY7227210.1 PEP/pyruvate-binding domain-containing protein [Hyalangium sp. s54d21]
MSALFRRFEEAEQVEEVGGKAHSLGRMQRLSIPVPEGFIVTNAAFQGFLSQDGLGEYIRGLHAGLRREDLPALEAASQRIQELVLTAPLPASFREQLAAWRSRWLEGEELIVRSSAVGEDSQEASFAGQLDSHLHVRTPEELERALAACWASYWSRRSLSYQLSRGVPLRGMGVVVQRLIPSRVAGVLFTRGPAGALGEEMLAEYCYGQGEALVSGRLNPGSFTISRGDYRWRLLATPEQEEDGAAELLDTERVAQLGRQGLLLEEKFGGPQDIEWTIDGDGHLYFVQARPITAPLGEKKPPPSEEAPGALWSNANISENFPGPVTPLLYSVAAEGYRCYFRNLARAFGLSSRRLERMESPLRHLIGAHGARLYYNLTNIHAVLRAAPYGELLARYFDQFVGAPAAPDAPADKARESQLSRALELGVIVFKTGRLYLSMEQRLQEFERTVDTFCARAHPKRLADKPLSELREDLRGFLDIRFNRWTHASLADAAAMVCYGGLQQFLRHEFPAPEQAALHNTLLKGLSDLASSAPIDALWALSRRVRQSPELRTLFSTCTGSELLQRVRAGAFPEFNAALDDFLERFGFRGSGELMLTQPSFQEDPTGLLEILKGYVGLEGPSPAERLSTQTAEREAITARIRQELGRRRWGGFVPFTDRARLFEHLLRWTQQAVGFRERARMKQALLYTRLRRIALAIGERLVKQGHLRATDDIFFLTYPEIDALLSGTAMFAGGTAALVALRRAHHEELSRLNPPDTFTLREGEALTEALSDPFEDAAQDGGPLTGTGTCGGTVTARGTVMRDLSDSHLLTAGDILVTRQTDPGWAPVFFLIKGLVMERGGMLSHGSILAREFGLPSVVGVKDATQRIRQGQTLSVDGDLGHVRALD